MDIYIDIETLRSPEAHRLELLEEVKNNFKAPSTLTKGQAAIDLGITNKDTIKFTSKDEMIARWERELAGEKSGAVAQTQWEKTSFDPNVAPIACICIGWYNNHKWCFESFYMCEDYFNEESAMLYDFHRKIEDLSGGTPVNFIGHYLGKFDLPFIWKRSIINGVKPVGGVKWIDGRHEQHHFCTMQAWAGFGNKISADKLSGILGVQGKTDMDGSMVYDAWQKDPKKVIDYCHDDVAMVRDIHNKMVGRDV